MKVKQQKLKLKKSKGEKKGKRRSIYNECINQHWKRRKQNKIIKIESKGKGFFINTLPFPNSPNL